MAPEFQPPPAVPCRLCPSKVRWVASYKHQLPLEAEPDPSGPLVLQWDRDLKMLVAVGYVEKLHGESPRYRSHLDRCRPPRESPPMPALAPKPDPTAGLKFPRRRVGPFLPLEQLMGVPRGR